MNEQKLTICAVSSFESAHFRDRMNAIAKKGHHVHFLCPSKGSSNRAAEFQSIYKSLRDLNPDLIHIHFAGGPFAALACLWSKCPIVVTVMGGDILFKEQPHPTLSSTFLSKAILRCADGITAKSYFLIAEMKRLNITNVEPIRILWGIDTNRFHPHHDTSAIRKKLSLNTTDQVIFSPKGLHPLYNIDTLFRAFSLASQKQPTLKLLISEMGADPEYRKNLLSLRNELGLENKIFFLGTISHQEMPIYYNLADIICSVPQSDGLPHSLFEAMACGKPNIISNLERYKEVVSPDEHAIMVNPRDEKELAHKILEVLQNPKLRTKLMNNALEQVRKIADRDSELRRVEELYFKVLGERSRKKISGVLKSKLISFLISHYGEVAAKRVFKIGNK